MPIIAGVTITWTDYTAPTTPRFVNIPDGAGDVTAEDLWDTLSEISALEESLQFAKLIDRPKGGGKSVLSPSKLVGITLVLNNAQIKFPDQPGPSYVIKRVLDGNVIAQDHLGVSIEAVASSDFTNWKNEADVSAALLNTTSGLTAAEAADLLLARELVEADEFFDQSAGLLHYFRRGTSIDLIPAKTVIGTTTQADASARQ